MESVPSGGQVAHARPSRPRAVSVPDTPDGVMRSLERPDIQVTRTMCHSQTEYVNWTNCHQLSREKVADMVQT